MISHLIFKGKHKNVCSGLELTIHLPTLIEVNQIKMFSILLNIAIIFISFGQVFAGHYQGEKKTDKFNLIMYKNLFNLTLDECEHNIYARGRGL